jgi:hypothetical protein
MLEMEQAMQAQQWQDTKKAVEALDTVKDACSAGMTDIKNIYDPLTDKWHVWCIANLQPNEMAFIKARYLNLKAFVDIMA